VSAQPARERSLNLAATIRNLARLIGYSGGSGKRLVLTCIALAALAAAIDAASLALLRRTLGAGMTTQGGELYAAMAFLLAALAGSVLRLVAQGRTVRAQFAVGNALAVRAFRNLQGQSYADYVRRGPSEGFATFERLQTVTYFGVNQLISAAAAALGAVVILLGLALLYPLAAALMTVPLVGIVIEAAVRGGRGNKTAGLSELSAERALLLFEARTGFRHIFLANGQERMGADFARLEASYRGEQARAALAGQSSRHTIEIAGILAALCVLGVASIYPLPATTLVPLLAVMALAIFRLLPQLAALRSAFRLISLHADVAEDVRDLLEWQTVEAVAAAASPVGFEHAIALSGIAVARSDRPVTLDGLDLTIQRGERIGIRGESGIGKSSLLDIICGAIAPDGGSIAIDGVALDARNGRAWRERIGVVSQNPVLLGATLREAVVFPDHPDAADASRFAAALAGAGVSEMVAAFPRGLDTPVGEASNLLSGGQRQRLALAHALYRARDLLVLDEATGQLDPDSEAAIVAAVAALPRDLTIIVASHRAAAFACCDTIYRLEGGRLVKER